MNASALQYHVDRLSGKDRWFDLWNNRFLTMKCGFSHVRAKIAQAFVGGVPKVYRIHRAIREHRIVW